MQNSLLIESTSQQEDTVIQGYRRIQEDTGGYKRIQECPGGYRRMQGDTGIQ